MLLRLLAKNSDRKSVKDSRIESPNVKRVSRKPLPGRASCGLDKIPFEEIASLSMVEMRDLYIRMLEGDVEARNRLAMSVSRFALNRTVQARSKRASLEDLFQQAMCDLLADMHRYDPSRGSITTFANWRIFGAIQKIYEDTKDIRMPVGTQKLSQEIDAILVQEGKNISDQGERLRVASELVPSKKKAKKVATSKPRGVYYSSEICNSITASTKHSYEHEDFDKVDNNDNIEQIKKAFSKLNKQEAKIIRKFLAGNTLKETAIEMDLTTEAVRKLEDRAIEKLSAAVGRKQQLKLRSQRAIQ